MPKIITIRIELYRLCGNQDSWQGKFIYYFIAIVLHTVHMFEKILVFYFATLRKYPPPPPVLFGISSLLRELFAQLQERREGQGTAAKQRLAAVPCPSLCFCGWSESSHKWPTNKDTIWKVTEHKWKQLILVVNFLLVWEWMRFKIRPMMGIYKSLPDTWM